MKALRKTNWNTYRITGYTHDIANDPASQGGVHLHQVRKNRGWQKRIVQSNGKHRACGQIVFISDDEGEQCFELAKKLD